MKRTREELLEEARTTHLLFIGILSAITGGRSKYARSRALQWARGWVEDYDRYQRDAVLHRLAVRAHRRDIANKRRAERRKPTPL